jgi:hypothetical protein
MIIVLWHLGHWQDKSSPCTHMLQGPIYGSAVSFGVLMIGAILTSLGVTDIGVESGSFADSLLVRGHQAATLKLLDA